MGLEFEVEDQPDLTIPEDTICRAKLVDLKKHTFDWTDYKDKERPGQPVKKVGETLQWWFEVTEGQHKERRVKLETRCKITNHPRDKFRLTAETLLGRELPYGTRINTDDLVGLSADISVKHRADKKDPSKFYEEVDEVMPITHAFDVGQGQPPF